MGEYPPQKHNFYPEINYAEQNGYLKLLIGSVSGNGRRKRGVSCLPITFDYQKWHKPLQFPIELTVFEFSTTTSSIRFSPVFKNFL